MTIRDLIDSLENAAADLSDDTEVRVALQPTYPLSGSVQALSAGEDGLLWLAVSGGEGYDVPRSAWSDDYLEV